MSANSQQKVSQVIEELENRLLMHAPRPSQITSAFLDNRGQALFTVSVGLDKSTLSRKSATFLTAGVDGQFGTADDARVYTAVGYRKGILTLRATIPVNQRYRIRLNGAAIKDENGLALDGEFKAGLPSGDGFAGGNYDIVSNGARKTTARFSTVSGYINMRLFGKAAPITAANFLHYTNEGAWDNTFFHRSIPGFVIQAGGFDVSASNQLGQVHQEAAIQNEFGVSNTRGTVAMARAVDGNEATTTDQNSATNQFFFNLSDSNAANLDHQEGGFAVFGQVLDDGSLQVMDAIASKPRIDASSITSAFDNLPVRNATALSSRALDPKGDLILITRVAMLMDPSATPNVQSSIKRSITPATTTTSVAAAPLFAVKKIEPDQGDSVLA